MKFERFRCFHPKAFCRTSILDLAPKWICSSDFCFSARRVQLIQTFQLTRDFRAQLYLEPNCELYLCAMPSLPLSLKYVGSILINSAQTFMEAEYGLLLF